jgi:ABC-type transport system involved in multi-copper enzyme maturation permease subunit
VGKNEQEENMLKKKFREIIVPALLRLSILLIFPLLSFLLGVFQYIYISRITYYSFISFTIGLVTIWIASTYGIDAFKYEHRDQALEYLLSFPLSRYKIVLYKLIPRVSILMVLIAVNLVVAFIGLAEYFEGEGLLFHVIIIFAPICLAMFFLLSGFFVSMFFEKKRSRIALNTMAIVSMTVVSLGIHSLLMSTSLVRQVFDISFSAGCLVVVAVMGTAFVSVYRKMDLKPASLHGRKFTWRVLPPLLVLTVLGILLLIM